MKRNEEQGRTKVVIRHLPPLLSEDLFWAEIGVWLERATWSAYYPGKSSAKGRTWSRAYINFKDPADVLHFSAAFHSSKFAGEGGKDPRPHVEYAPYQRTPPTGVRRDPREGTLDRDQEFQAFVKRMSEDPGSLAALKLSEPDEAAQEAQGPTALVEYLRNKRAEAKGKTTGVKGKAKGTKEHGKALSSKASKKIPIPVPIPLTSASKPPSTTTKPKSKPKDKAPKIKIKAKDNDARVLAVPAGPASSAATPTSTAKAPPLNTAPASKPATVQRVKKKAVPVRPGVASGPDPPDAGARALPQEQQPAKQAPGRRGGKAVAATTPTAAVPAQLPPAQHGEGAHGPPPKPERGDPPKRPPAGTKHSGGAVREQKKAVIVPVVLKRAATGPKTPVPTKDDDAMPASDARGTRPVAVPVPGPKSRVREGFQPFQPKRFGRLAETEAAATAAPPPAAPKAPARKKTAAPAAASGG